MADAKDLWDSMKKAPIPAAESFSPNRTPTTIPMRRDPVRSPTKIIKDMVMPYADMSALAINSASGGLYDDAWGALNVAKDAVTGGLIGDKTMSDSYMEGVQGEEIRQALARDRMPFLQEFVADVGGNFIPGGWASRLNRQMDKGTLVQEGKGLLGVASRMLHEGKKGAVDEIMRGMFEGERGIDEVALSGLEGLSGGIVGQAILGEAAPALYKYGLMRMGTDEKVGSVLLDQGLNTEGMTAANIRGQYSNMIHNNTGLLTIPSVGNAKGDTAANRIADLVARSTFAGKATLAQRTDEAAMYADTMGFIGKALKDANKKMVNRITGTFKIPDSPYSKFINSGNLLEESKKFYASLGETAAGRLGAVPVRYRDVENGMKAKLIASTNSTKGDYTTVPDEYQEAMNIALHKMRLTVEHPNAGTTQKATSGVPNDKSPAHTDRDFDVMQVPLANLLAARKEVMKQATPGAAIRGDAEKALDTRAASAVAKLIDDEIDARSGMQYGRKRQNFAQVRQLQDANEMGQHFFIPSNSADPVTQKSMTEYRDTLKTKEAKSAFDTGWMEQFSESIRKDGLDTAIYSKIGDVDFRANDFNANSLKSEGWEQMVAIMGKDKATQFLNDAKDLPEKATALARIEQNLTEKGYDPVSILSTIRNGDDLLLAAGGLPGQNSLMANATLAALGRRASDFGPDVAARATELAGATGEKAAGILEDIIKADQMPSNYGVGMEVSTGTGDAVFNEEQRTAPTADPANHPRTFVEDALKRLSER